MEQESTHALPPPTPVAVTVGTSPHGHYHEGDEVVLTFHAIPEWLEVLIGYAFMAMGWHMERKDGNIVCRVKVVEPTSTYYPARIEFGRMAETGDPLHAQSIGNACPKCSSSVTT